MPGYTVYYLMMKKEDEGIRMKILSSYDLENNPPAELDEAARNGWRTLWIHFDKVFLWNVFDVITAGAYIESAEDDLVFLPMREVLRRRDELDKKIDILKALENIFLFIGEICNITPRYTRWKDQ